MPAPFSPNADELLAYNADDASQFHDNQLQVEPQRKLAVVACTDSRIDAFAVLGLANGDAHEPALRVELEQEPGVNPWWSMETFTDPYADVRQSVKRLRMTPFIRHKDHIRGFVHDVTDGHLHEATLDD